MADATDLSKLSVTDGNTVNESGEFRETLTDNADGNPEPSVHSVE